MLNSVIQKCILNSCGIAIFNNHAHDVSKEVACTGDDVRKSIDFGLKRFDDVARCDFIRGSRSK